MGAGQVKRTDIPAGNDKSSGDAFPLSVGKYVVRACSAKTDSQISADIAKYPDKVGNIQRK